MNSINRNVVRLPVTFDRRFQVWHYNVTHSRLLLKSLATEDEDGIEIVFRGVVAVSLRMSYKPLQLAESASRELTRMLRVADIDEARAVGKLHCVTLGGDAEDGLVLCAGGSIMSIDRERQFSSKGFADDGSRLIGHIDL